MSNSAKLINDNGDGTMTVEINGRQFTINTAEGKSPVASPAKDDATSSSDESSVEVTKPSIVVPPVVAEKQPPMLHPSPMSPMSDTQSEKDLDISLFAKLKGQQQQPSPTSTGKEEADDDIGLPDIKSEPDPSPQKRERSLSPEPEPPVEKKAKTNSRRSKPVRAIDYLTKVPMEDFESCIAASTKCCIHRGDVSRIARGKRARCFAVSKGGVYHNRQITFRFLDADNEEIEPSGEGEDNVSDDESEITDADADADFDPKPEASKSPAKSSPARSDRSAVSRVSFASNQTSSSGSAVSDFKPANKRQKDWSDGNNLTPRAHSDRPSLQPKQVYVPDAGPSMAEKQKKRLQAQLRNNTYCTYVPDNLQDITCFGHNRNRCPGNAVIGACGHVHCLVCLTKFCFENHKALHCMYCRATFKTIHQIGA
jgi:hypothetical protein